MVSWRTHFCVPRSQSCERVLAAVSAAFAQPSPQGVNFYSIEKEIELGKQLAADTQTSQQAQPDARLQALGRVYQGVQAQAATLSYLDTFMVLAIGAGIMFVLAFIIRKNDPAAGGEVAVG